MENKKDKASDFLDRNSVDGKIHVQAALLELWARHKTSLDIIEELKEALGGCAKYMEMMEERISKLEPTIKIVSETEAKHILKNK